MQLDTRDGIRCDRCGMTQHEDFLYYSFDYDMVEVVDNHRVLNTPVPPVFSLDICEKCMWDIGEAVKKNYKPVSAGICCDVTGTQLTGTYTFYTIKITKVDVKLAHKPLVCTTCRKQAVGQDPNVPCTCGASEYAREADTITDPDFLQLHVSEASYTDLRNKAMKLRATAANVTSKPE